MHWPEAVSHILIVLSLEADASRLPSSDHAIDVIKSLCPARVDVHWPVAGSHILTVLSKEADASRLPSGDQAIDLTK